MVHALEEIWRVLAPGGIMVDLRPFTEHSPVEVVADGQVASAGRLDEPQPDPDDRAANAALAQVERDRVFICERRGAFDLSYYWDTPGEMKAYIDGEWTIARLPEEVFAEAVRLAARAGASARVRVRRNMIISRWRKWQT
jgi:hypothetical protein